MKPGPRRLGVPWHVRGVALAWTLLAGVAHAQATPEQIASAAEQFELGKKAYLAKDYAEAAVHFENAHRDAPRAETLRLAIRARRDARQPARAATLAALSLALYNDEGSQKYASETIEASAPGLQRYDIACAAPCTVIADGRLVLTTPSVKHALFVDPGAHDLGIFFGADGGSVSRRVDAKSGATEALSFVPERRIAPPPPPPPHEPVATKPFGPLVFFVGAGLTLVAGGLTIASGIDTQNSPGKDAVREACAGQDESCALFQEGQDKELRTNILLGASIGLAVVAGVIGIFFTQWSTPKQQTGFLTPSGFALRF